MKITAFDQEYGRIPNMAFYKIVRHFGVGRGLPVLTWAQQWTVFKTYIDIAKRLN